MPDTGGGQQKERDTSTMALIDIGGFARELF